VVLETTGVPADGLLLNIYSSAAQLFIAVSAAVAILAFFGCCGAFKVIIVLFLKFTEPLALIGQMCLCYHKN
jgi:hypothetical protein